MFAPYLAPVGVFTFLTLAQNVIADGLFVGCYKNGAFSAQITPPADDSLSCSTVCGSVGCPFSAFESDTTTCSCSQYFPTGYYMTPGTDKACDSSSSLQVRVTKTSFSNLGCLDSAGYKDDGYVDTERYCKNDSELGLILVAPQLIDLCDNILQGAATYTCHCAAGGLEMVGNSVTCAINTYFTFYHSADAQASSLSRRTSREIREFKAQQLARRTEYCPYGLTACNVGGHSGNYEVSTNANPSKV
ncbi:hypothetical protein I204_06275 [Kwoniella mangroviensis CBS 8886]|nr:hypothetical protein I204_06275 [Kwoniella mangroviensis CBS 8886]